MITIVSLVTIHHHTQLQWLFLVMRTFKNYSHSNFQVYNMVLRMKCRHRAVRCIPVTYLFYSQNFVPLSHFIHFAHPQPSVSEKATAPHSSTLAWRLPWTEEPGGLQSMGSLRVAKWLHFHFSLSCIGEGNGNPLQCFCLGNPRGGAWWAAIYGVAQSRTRLKRLSSSSSPLSLATTNLFSQLFFVCF